MFANAMIDRSNVLLVLVVCCLIWDQRLIILVSRSLKELFASLHAYLRMLAIRNRFAATLLFNLALEQAHVL